MSRDILDEFDQQRGQPEYHRVRTFADLRPELVGAVEWLIEILLRPRLCQRPAT